MAPADSLQQAAGRANREGRGPDLGLVVVFDPIESENPRTKKKRVPRGYLTPMGVTGKYFGPGLADPDNVDVLNRYYQHLYNSLNLESSNPGKEIQDNRARFDFEAVADGPLLDGGRNQERDLSRAFRMLDDDSVPVAVDYDPSVTTLLDKLRTEEGSRRDTFRALRPFIVNYPRRLLTIPAVAAMTQPVVGDLLHWRGDYDRHAIGIDEGAIGKDNVW
jgi:CRISPR-associated endonuclease/helicase Cas3